MKEVEAKHMAIIGGSLLGAYLLYDYLKHKGYIRASSQGAERTQTVTTSGVTQNYRPRTTYNLGNAGSISEINRLPENHLRGQLVAPLWRLWSGTFGSIRPEQVTGTFGDGERGLPFPEEVHVTPELEAALAESVERRVWLGGGATPVTGTFG